MRAWMNRLSAGLLCLVLAVPARAESPAVLSPGDVLHGRFTQERHLVGFTAPLRSSGQFVLSPGRGLIWRVEAPFPVSTAMTDKGIVQFNGETEMLRLDAAQAPFVTHMFAALGGALSGDLAALKAYFQVTAAQAGESWRLALTPLDAGMEATMQLRGIDITGGRFVEEVTVSRASGDRDVIRFTDQKLGGALAPAESAIFDRLDAE